MTKRKTAKRPKTRLDRFTPPQPNRSSSQTHWVPPTFDKETRQSTKLEEEPIHSHQKLADDAMPDTGKNDGLFWFFPTAIGSPKPNPTTPISSFIVLLRDLAKESKENMVRPWRKSKKGSHDSHLWTPIPKRRFRTRFSMNIQSKSTQEQRIHASLQYGGNECTYVIIG